jgi:hypothetical protein
MALTTQTYAEQVGRAYADVMQGDPDVLELWVSMVPGCVHVWLIMPLSEMEVERRLHGYTDLVYDRFGTVDTDIFLHTLNPRHFRGDVRNVVPCNAVQIPLDPT